MLVALNENKQFIILNASYSPEQLQSMKKRLFLCPQCAEPVILKAGPIKIPHFAHKQTSSCDQLFTERESAQHLTGKLHLHSWLQSKNVHVQLESTISTLQQRPDLLAEVKGHKYAIEFQCSPISEELFESRTNGYISINITPLWIPKSMHKLKKWKVQAFKLTHFQRRFIKKGKSGPYYISYDVENRQFIYFTNLLFLSPTHCVAAVDYLPLHLQHLPLLQPAKISKTVFKQMFGLFRNRQQGFLQSSFVFGQAKIRSLLWRSLYELRILYDDIPLTVGIPVKYSEYVGRTTLEWQVALHYFVQLYQMPFSSINETVIEQFLQWAQYNKCYEAQMAINNYVNICIQLNIETVHSAVHLMELIDAIYMQFVAISEKN